VHAPLLLRRRSSTLEDSNVYTRRNPAGLRVRWSTYFLLPFNLFILEKLEVSNVVCPRLICSPDFIGGLLSKLLMPTICEDGVPLIPVIVNKLRLRWALSLCPCLAFNHLVLFTSSVCCLLLQVHHQELLL
jgi:hypothetical protein